MAEKFYNRAYLATGEKIFDLTQDDVQPEHVQNGIYFHDKTGRRQQGTNTKTVDASNVTAEAAHVLYPNTFGKGSEVQTGSMPDNSNLPVEISTVEGTPLPWGYTDGSVVAKIADSELAKLIPSNIKEGISILGVGGEFGADDISSQTKTVTPTFEEQTFNPSDDGVTFYSSIKVNAIPVTRTENEFGGITVTIG